MPVVKLSPARYTIEDLGDSLKITIPSRKHWFSIPFCFLWLAAWAFGEIVTSSGLIRAAFILSSAPSATRSVYICLSLGWLFLGVWTVYGAFVLYALLWQLLGKEIVEVSSQSIQVRRQVLGLGRLKEYLAEHIKNLRISPMGHNKLGRSSIRSFLGLAGSLVTFDYGAKTFRFGSRADEAEAKQILTAIQQRFPQYWSDR